MSQIDNNLQVDFALPIDNAAIDGIHSAGDAREKGEHRVDSADIPLSIGELIESFK